VVVASKVFVYEGEAGGSAVYQGAGLDMGVTERESARDYDVFAIQLIFC
jgi:hypothetical protein